MIEDSNKSGNTYIEFSFEKSLRKYQKPPCKKIKPSQSTNNNNYITSNSVCKLYRRDSIQSTDRKVNIQSSRKNEFIRSRNVGRQFSQVQKRIEFSNSAKKSIQNSLQRQLQESQKNNKLSISIPNPLSQFNLGEQLNLNELRREAVLNLSLNKEVPRRQCFEVSGAKKLKSNQMQNELSIQRILRINNLMECKMQKQNCTVRRKLDMFNLQCQEENSRIIEEQDESFSQISIAQSNLVIHSKLFQNNQRELHREEQMVEMKYPAVSCAYFSSCSSIRSFSSSIQSDHKQRQKDKQAENERQHLQEKRDDAINQSQSDQDNFDQDNPFEHLKLQSKEQLKKQVRNQYRQRVFYKIKKITQVEQACSECQSLSQDLIKQLTQQNQNKVEQNLSQKIDQQILDQTINRFQEQFSIQPQNKNTNSTQMENQNEQSTQKDEFIECITQTHQSQNPFKRARPCPATKSEKNQSLKKPKRINFQIDQNYQRLGRVTFTGLGLQNQSICLSIRRFSHEIKPSHELETASVEHQSVFIDKAKIINYLISQRPYLQKNRSQLTEVLSNFIDSNKNQSQS